MSWINLDDGILEHPKFIRAVNSGGSEALHLWLGLRAYCAKHLTDGVIPADMLGEVRGPKVPGTRQRAFRVLEEVGLIHRPDPAGPVTMHNYLDWAPSRDEVLSKRASARERQAKSRNMSQRDSARTGEKVSEQSQPPNPKPKPNRSKPEAEFSPAEPGDQTEPPEKSDHAKLREHFAAAFARARGVPHKLPSNQGGRYAKAAKDLLDAYGLAESCQIIDRALGDPWQLEHGPELWSIVANASKFRGKSTGLTIPTRAAPGSNFERLRARAERIEAEERALEAANAAR